MEVVTRATPLELVELERKGVPSAILKDIARQLGLPQARVFEMLGVPKATAERKVAAGETIAGMGGQAIIGVARLLARAHEIVANSTAPEARGFDTEKWLGRWLETPQPSLGGRKSSELIDTRTGLDVVLRLLGALQSGAYQ
ncbi:antitoxin Xre/MbcA/ParS toxin-binding domain-containing protein [Ramlibacter albus]|uniref:antitoxin Xre/MbcA/ParS toxin-binding domain-containing protein n=1 Tax=Ramlibacter albus TaxID=2079448 RepID=UPI00338E72F7